MVTIANGVAQLVLTGAKDNAHIEGAINNDDLKRTKSEENPKDPLLRVNAGRKSLCFLPALCSVALLCPQFLAVVGTEHVSGLQGGEEGGNQRRRLKVDQKKGIIVFISGSDYSVSSFDLDFFPC
jgi:hypothetical protein